MLFFKTVFKCDLQLCQLHYTLIPSESYWIMTWFIFVHTSVSRFKEVIRSYGSQLFFTFLGSFPTICGEKSMIPILNEECRNETIFGSCVIICKIGIVSQENERRQIYWMTIYHLLLICMIWELLLYLPCPHNVIHIHTFVISFPSLFVSLCDKSFLLGFCVQCVRAKKAAVFSFVLTSLPHRLPFWWSSPLSQLLGTQWLNSRWTNLGGTWKVPPRIEGALHKGVVGKVRKGPWGPRNRVGNDLILNI